MSSGNDEHTPTVEQLREQVRGGDNVPRHVAVIMDGNGRWASRRRLPRVAGHRAGRQAVRRTVEAAVRCGVRYLTLYTFSQENWKRSQTEVKALWSFLEEVLAHERDELDRQGVSLVATGELDMIPDKARAALQQVIDSLAHNDRMVLNLALAYGGRTEILRAGTELARRIVAGELDPNDIDEAAFRQGLYAPEIPDPDLVIRTSGESRVSNFLLWQIAYSEFHFTPVLWPDFGERELLIALADYQSRERRFGAAETSHDPADRRHGLLDPARWKRLLKVRS
jgi:undecaprenyl diphosphate synthase